MKKAKEILEAADMSQEGINNFMKDDELIYSVFSDPETALKWNERNPKCPLNEGHYYGILKNVYLEMS